MFLKCPRRGRGEGLALLATWQASGKLFILQYCQQVSTGSVGVRIEKWIGEQSGGEREEGRDRGMARASVKEINGLQIGKVNMSCALPVSCPGTGRWLQRPRRLCLGLTYFIPGQGWTGHGRDKALLRGLSANTKMRFLSCLMPLPACSLYLSLSLCVRGGTRA